MVVNSKLLYASSVWASGGVKTAKKIAALSRTQRTVALRTTRAYRTISLEASLFLADNIPADLLAHERSQIRRRINDNEQTTTSTIRRTERDITINGWQRAWSRSTNAAWTRKILPDLNRWRNRSLRTLTFHLTQFLTGHGCFRHYLHRIGRVDSAACLYCRHTDDTAEHAVLECPKFSRERIETSAFLGGRDITATDVQDILCGPEHLPHNIDDSARNARLSGASLRCTHSFIDLVDKIMTIREQDERHRENEANQARPQPAIQRHRGG